MGIVLVVYIDNSNQKSSYLIIRTLHNTGCMCVKCQQIWAKYNDEKEKEKERIQAKNKEV